MTSSTAPTTSAPTASFAVKDVAAYLAKELGGSSACWVTWLANDRKPERANRLPPVRGPGRPRYLGAAVQAFVDAERARRMQRSGPSGRVAEVMRAFGIGESDGSSTGRRLDCQVSAQLDEATGEGFVQMAVASPLRIYRLEPAQARELALQLAREAKDAERLAQIHNNPQGSIS